MNFLKENKAKRVIYEMADGGNGKQIRYEIFGRNEQSQSSFA